MNKATQRALETYPIKEEWTGNQYGDYGDINSIQRIAFLQGYHQAEQDNELTIEDMERIHTFLYAIKNNKRGCFTFTRLSDEQYQEAITRFKEYKEKKQ